MTHYHHRLPGPAVLKANDQVVLAGFAAEEVDGVVVSVGAGLVAGDEHSFVVVEADDGVSSVVADVEAVEIVATKENGFAVSGLGFVRVSFRDADYELF